MRAIALLLCLALALPAIAGEPVAAAADAPVRVKAGSVAPFDGVLDTEAHRLADERLIADLTGQVKVYEARPPTPLLVVVIIAGVAVAAGAAVGGFYLGQSLTKG